jgi:NAD(P)-dependent dehydrogenase (short-subunit alcohol dehydrogenase family)
VIEFNQRAVLVTGAGAGIGRAAAHEFAALGAMVTVVDNSDHGHETAQEILQRNGQAVFCQADVTHEPDVQRAVSTAARMWGRLDVIANVVGGGKPGKTVSDLERKDWDESLALNLTSVFLMSKYAIPEIASGGGGAVVNVASSAGVYGSPANPSYVAAKGGVIALTRAMAIDHARQGIRVNCVAPGSTSTSLALRNRSDREIDDIAKTNLFRRLANPDEIARVIVFLASDSASFLTGQTLSVDAGRGLGGGRSWQV